MRAVALISILTLAAGGLVAVACGGSEETVNSAPADAGRETGAGSSSGDAGRDGGSSGEDANTGPCNALMQQGANVQAQGSPDFQPHTGTGGPVADGTYVVVSAAAQTPFAISQALGAITLQITGTTANAVSTTAAGVTDTHSGSFTTNGTNFALTSTCTTSLDPLNFTGTYTIGSDAGTPHLSIHIMFESPIGAIPATINFAKL